MQSLIFESHAFDRPTIGMIEDIRDDSSEDNVDKLMGNFTIGDFLWRSQKFNSMALISNLQMKLHAISCF